MAYEKACDMKRIAKLGLCFLVIVIPIFIGLATAGKMAEPKYVPAGWARAVAAHLQRVDTYLSYPQDTPATVIIGASTAAYLGDNKKKGIYNIAIGGTSINDHKRMLSLCRQADKVLYVVTFREIAFKDRPARLARAAPLEYLRIARACILDYLQPLSPPAPWANRKEEVIQYQLEIFSDDIPMDIAPLVEIASRHPQITFVLSPVMPKTPEVVRVCDAFEEAMIASGYPVINLSHAVSLEYFSEYDFLHPNKEGKKIVRREFMSQISS